MYFFAKRSDVLFLLRLYKYMHTCYIQYYVIGGPLALVTNNVALPAVCKADLVNSKFVGKEVLINNRLSSQL